MPLKGFTVRWAEHMGGTVEANNDDAFITSCLVYYLGKIRPRSGRSHVVGKDDTPFVRNNQWNGRAGRRSWNVLERHYPISLINLVHVAQSVSASIAEATPHSPIVT